LNPKTKTHFMAKNLVAFGFLVLVKSLFSNTPTGIVNIVLESGTPQSPSFSILSPGIDGEPLFRGNTLSIQENNVTFEKIPDISNPAVLKGPFTPGVLGSRKARASAVLDENGSIDSITLVDAGANYLGTPTIDISPPMDGNGTASEIFPAYAETETDSSTQQVSSIHIVNRGLGYQNLPQVSIDGGPYFIRIMDNESNYSGLFFRILSNSEDALELDNSSGFDLTTICPSGTEVEVFNGWTLGSLLGYGSTQLYSDQNESLADWVYVVKEFSQQEGNSSDYIPYFHDGDHWKEVYPPQNISSHLIIEPDQSLIVARRTEGALNLAISGYASTQSSYWELPETGKKKLVCNPHSSSIQLSDLVPSQSITEDNSSISGHLFLAHKDQDKADNLQVLKSSIWSTYWHDGTNLNISTPARISARSGSGIGGALTVNDFSMTSGQIESISNPSNGNVLVISSNHGLSNGFMVSISSVVGRLTNEEKIQVNASGDPVNQGEGLVVESSVNGTWEVINASSNSFELKDCQSNSDYIHNGEANWSTGTPGEGYDTNVRLSIIGGGGQGAKAVGIVEDGKIVRISLLEGGFFYHLIPEVLVHPGGWRMLENGNRPLNDLTVPAGSGVLILRKHPFGTRAKVPISSLY